MSTHSDSGPIRPARTYHEFTGGLSWKTRSRAAARDISIRLLSLNCRAARSSGWIRMPYYHHVFDDERQGFARQVDYLSEFGEFIGLDDALALLDSGSVIDGRYFCLSFDDGFKSCATGALPILAERDIPATFYVVTSMIGKILTPGDPIARDGFGFKSNTTGLEFLDWDDCRTLSAAGMTIGSHCQNHVQLSSLDAREAEIELRQSREIIENELLLPCRHFCPPFGIPGIDFDPARDGGLVRSAGYQSLATGCRGPNRQGCSPFALRRDQLIAHWGRHQLRYFFFGT